MKKKFIRLISVMLVAAMALVILSACGNDGGSGSGGGNKSGFKDSIPDDVKFEGETFTILARQDGFNSSYEHEIAADENETETVNQAVFERNAKIETRFGCKIEPYFTPGSWNDSDNFLNTLKNSVMSNSQAFDLVMGYQAYMAGLGLNEYYANLYDPEFKYINFNADYYYKDIIEELTVNNQLYYLVGDYTLSYLETLYVLYFNKQTAENLGIGDLYQQVRDGTWTIDKLIEYSRKAYEDTDGDGYKTPSDSFGFVTKYSNSADALFSEFDCHLTSKDETGKPVFNVDSSKIVAILEKMINFCEEDNAYSFQDTSDNAIGEMPVDEIFETGRSLFYPERLFYAQLFRDIETDFGIIPFPKWDENQAGYYTQSQNSYSVMIVPSDVGNKAFSGAMIEALSAESANDGGVTDAYYDIALKDKYSRDDESGEMIDIARDGIKVNFGYFHAVPLGSATQIFRTLLEKKMTTFVSYWAENQNGYTRSLNKILKSYGVES